MDTLHRLFLAAEVSPALFRCDPATPIGGSAGDALSCPDVRQRAGECRHQRTFETVQVRKTGAGALKWTVVQPAAAWVTVSPTGGTNNVTLTLQFQTSGLAAQTQPYTTSFRVVSGTQSVTVNVAVTIVGSTPPPTLTITCPANISVASPDGSPVVVTYTVTTAGGTLR